MIRPLKEYMELTRTTQVQIAKMTGSSQQLVSERLGRGKTYVDWNMNTGDVKKIWIENVIYRAEEPCQKTA